MKKTDSMKEMILIKKLKADDPIELPMDEAFFDSLHDKIMMNVEKTEVKPVSKWQKSWVFLERKTAGPREKIKKSAKAGLAVATLALGLGVIKSALNFAQDAQLELANINKNTIISEVKKNPEEWSEMVVNYQSENDFYADILSQQDLGTMVEIDQVISQSL